jgi:hypothetical protein
MSPRRRIEPWEARAKQLQQEANDRSYREQVLAKQAPQVIPEPDLPPAFNYDRLTLELRASAWVKQRFSGCSERQQQGLAQRVVDYLANGNHEALAKLDRKGCRSTFNPHWSLRGADYSPGMQLIPKPW